MLIDWSPHLRESTFKLLNQQGDTVIGHSIYVLIVTYALLIDIYKYSRDRYGENQSTNIHSHLNFHILAKFTKFLVMSTILIWSV